MNELGKSNNDAGVAMFELVVLLPVLILLIGVLIEGNRMLQEYRNLSRSLRILSIYLDEQPEYFQAHADTEIIAKRLQNRLIALHSLHEAKKIRVGVIRDRTRMIFTLIGETEYSVLFRMPFFGEDRKLRVVINTGRVAF